jgi:bacillithiol biosynthesis cysteine-adding enzyme BshC
MTADPMECHCIRAVDLPHATRLYSSYIQDFPSVAHFYAHPPTLESVKAVAAEIRPDLAMRRNVAEVLRTQNRAFGSDQSVQDALDRFASGAVAIVSGQQVGLFSGPSYTFYKALTALRMAEELNSAGTPAVAIFWLATEDHDLAEINHCFWPARDAVEKIELPTADFEGRRAGEVPLGEAVLGAVERATAKLEGPAADQVRSALAESYTPSDNYGSALGKLLARLFAGKGLILLDALSPDLHRLAQPLYRSALERHAELNQALLARGLELERANDHVQVKVTDESTLLFVTLDGKRLPLRARNGDFALGRRSFSLSELTELLANSPQDFSANVLFRPVVQDSLLSTAAYIAGPSEIAYFAQASVNYDRLLGRMPVILPRASFTLVDAHTVRLLRKYDLQFSDMLAGGPELRAKMEGTLLPKVLTRRFDAGEKSLQKMLTELREQLTKVDPTLGGAMDTAESKMLFQFSKIKEKAGRALAFRSSVLDAHERELTAQLYPHGELQERSVCFLPMLAMQGFELLDEIQRRIKLGGAQHQVLYL